MDFTDKTPAAVTRAAPVRDDPAPQQAKPAEARHDASTLQRQLVEAADRSPRVTQGRHPADRRHPEGEVM